MADMQIKGVLPKKEWFTLDDVAERWGSKVDDLLHYGLVNRMTLCVYVRATLAKFEQHAYFLNLFIEGEEPEEAGMEWVKVGEWRILYSPLPIYQYVVADMQKNETVTLTTFPSDDLNFSFSDEGYSNKFAYLAREGVEVGLSDIVISRREVDRFEREHGIGAYAGAMPDLSKPDEAEKIHKSKERTYLELIALMAVELGLPLDTPYTAHNILEVMRAKHGMELCSGETLRKRFKLITETIKLPNVSK